MKDDFSKGVLLVEWFCQVSQFVTTVLFPQTNKTYQNVDLAGKGKGKRGDKGKGGILSSCSERFRVGKGSTASNWSCLFEVPMQWFGLGSLGLQWGLGPGGLRNRVRHGRSEAARRPGRALERNGFKT